MCGHPPGHVPQSEAQLSQLEASHRIYDLYIWLTWRLEDAFPDRALVEGWRAQCSELIRKGLERMSRGRATPSRVSRQRSRLHASPIAEPRSQVDILAAAGVAALNIPPTSGPRGLATASGPSSSWGSTTTRRLGNGCAASGVRGYAKATVRHFPKHLVPKPGEAPRPVVPDAAQKDLETYDKYDLDPKAPLVFPERPAETRQQRRVRKREEGQLRVVERDFGEGILPPFRNHDPVEPVLPHFGPSLQPKRKKKSAKRHSSGSRPFPTS